MQVMKPLRVSLCALTLLIQVAPALAESSVPYGFYIEANVGGTKVTTSRTEGLDGAQLTGSSGVGVNGTMGYKINRYIGVEMGYTLYPSTTVRSLVVDTVDFDIAAPTSYYNVGQLQNTAVDLAARGIIPLQDSGVELFGKLGIARLSSRFSSTNLSNVVDTIGDTDENTEATYAYPSSHNTIGLYAGLGIQYYFSQECALNVQYDYARGNNTTGNFALWSGGISFLFG